MLKYVYKSNAFVSQIFWSYGDSWEEEAIKKGWEKYKYPDGPYYGWKLLINENKQKD